MFGVELNQLVENHCKIEEPTSTEALHDIETIIVEKLECEKAAITAEKNNFIQENLSHIIFSIVVRHSQCITSVYAISF